MNINLTKHELLYIAELIDNDIDVISDIIDSDHDARYIATRITAKTILRKIGALHEEK